MSELVFVLNSLKASGSERKAVNLANALSCRGHGVSVASLNPPHLLAHDLVSQVEHLPLHRRGKWSPQAVQHLAQHLRARKPRAVISFNLYPMLYARRASRGLSTSRWTWINLDRPTGFREHAQMLVYLPRLNQETGLLFGSREQRDRWVKRYHLSPEAAHTLYAGVDVNRFHPRELSERRGRQRKAWGVADETLVVGTVANHRPWKGLEWLLRCAARWRDDHHLALLGDGVDAPELRSLAETEPSQARVHWERPVADVRDFLAGLDVFVLPSRKELFSNAALEAMAMGLPVVLTRVGGLPELVDDTAGMLVEPGASEQLTAAVRALASDPERRKRLGAEARRRVEARFSVQAMTDGFEALVL